MVRFVLACAVCLLAIQDSLAATPATGAPPAAATIGRKQIEALLQAPADLDFGNHPTVTVGELLDMLHKRHHLSIRFDIPSLSGMYGFGIGGGAEKIKMVASRHSPRPTLIANLTSNAPTATTAPAKPAQTLAGPIQQSTYFAPQPALPPASTEVPESPSTLTSDQELADRIKRSLSSGQLHHYAIDVKVSDGNCWLKGSVHDQQQLAKVLKTASETQGIKKVVSEIMLTNPTLVAVAAAPTSPSLPSSSVAKEPSPKNETPPPPAPAKDTDTATEFLQEAGKIEVSVATIDGQTITVATALRLALDAFPNIDAEDSAGMPLAMTNATLLDFLAEDDGILITTRLKALTYKETRVYSIKSLKNANPTELSKVICQSIRPWSWRSRIDELGEQLKSGTSAIPPAMLAALVKSGMELSAGEGGIDLTTNNEQMAHPSDEVQQAAMIGNAVASAIVTFAHASLSTLEVIHYADPPTGSIRVLPGKLIITQSQAAHREIAELLKQLSDE